MRKMIIFDFDGVIADSEVISCTILAEQIRLFGVDISSEESIRLFVGKRFQDVEHLIQDIYGVILPLDFKVKYQKLVEIRFSEELLPIKGLVNFLRALTNLNKCIASSSSLTRLNFCLNLLNLHDEFRNRIYSADAVENGKPHPDIFIYAAKKNNFSPKDCIVIEDSASGVKAGVAAGMTVIGLLAGSHINNRNGRSLRLAGANFLAQNYTEVLHVISMVWGESLSAEHSAH